MAFIWDVAQTIVTSVFLFLLAQILIVGCGLWAQESAYSVLLAVQDLQGKCARCSLSSQVFLSVLQYATFYVDVLRENPLGARAHSELPQVQLFAE